MKKLILSIAISMALVLPLSAVPGFGYSISPVGERSADGAEFGALAISLSVSPYMELHLFDMDAEVLLSYTSPFFNGARLRLSAPLFKTEKHPFNFMFPNAVSWAPRISAGAEYRMPDEWSLYFSLSPFSFFDTGFGYEFFSPYGLYDFRRQSWGWGIYIMRFSVYFGG